MIRVVFERREVLFDADEAVYVEATGFIELVKDDEVKAWIQSSNVLYYEETTRI